MATKARKFKRKLAPKPIRRKEEPVLSVELVRKESLEKITEVWKKLISKLRSFQLKAS